MTARVAVRARAAVSGADRCVLCGLTAYVAWAWWRGRRLYLTYRCRNGHEWPVRTEFSS